MSTAAVYLNARNTLFRTAPRVADGLMRLTRIGGRGPGVDGDEAIRYFSAVFDDYLRIADAAGLGPELFANRDVFELGPGDTRAIALLARIHGARTVDGCDRFDIQVRDHDSLSSLYERLIASTDSKLTWPEARAIVSAVELFDSPQSAAAAKKQYDLVISRAVLEHVRDVDSLFAGLRLVTTPDAVMIHKIDLRSHGFELDHPLDFLLFTEDRWSRLTTHIGEPNRLRAPSYFSIAERHGFTVLAAWSSKTITEPEVNSVREQLAEPFRSMSASTLAVLGVWMVLVREGHPLAVGAKTIDSGHISKAPDGLSRY